MAGTKVRKVCLEILREWDDGTTFAEDLITRSSATISARDRALLRTLTFGVLRNLTLLDYWIGLYRKGKLDRQTAWVLRLGVYQVMMTRVRDHAAVNETVGLARRSARGVVNAILRRVIDERDSLQEDLEDLDLGTRYSMPEFLIERWESQFGEDAARKLCEWAQEPAPVYLRINRLKKESEQAFADTAGLEPTDQDGFYSADPVPTNLLEAGVAYAQDPSTVGACKLLKPVAGNAVLDACAAPGGKSVFLAELMQNQGSITATDPSKRRLKRLKQNLDRMGVSISKCFQWEWGVKDSDDTPPFGNAGFDRVLVDVPCSNTGVLRRRVDARWRLHDSIFEEMQRKQVAITLECMSQVRPGGCLVYSTCSLEEEENRGVIDKVLEQSEGWELVEERSTLPFRDGYDGAYAALLKKR